MTTVKFTSPDGATCQLRVYAGRPEAACVLVWPAMGVSNGYYVPLASALRERGLNVILCEHRGTGTSDQTPAKSPDFGYREMLRRDFPAVMAFAHQHFGPVPRVLWGHSLGGQLSCLYQAVCDPEQRADALVLTASGSVYFRAYPFPQNIKVLAGSQLANAIAKGLGHFPGHKLGFGGLQPRGVIRDWAQQARDGRYHPEGLNGALESLLRKTQTPTLAVSFQGDAYAPPSAVAHLTDKLGASAVEHWHLDADQLHAPRLDHFRWVKYSAPLTARVHDWLDAKLRRAQPPAA